MFKLIINTYSWMQTFAEIEIKKIGHKVSYLNEENFSIKIKSEKELKELIENIFYYSRTIKNVYLEIKEFENLEKISNKINLDFIPKKLSFEVDSHNKNRDKEEKEIGEIILNSNKNLFVNLSNPDISFKILKTSQTQRVSDGLGIVSKKNSLIGKKYIIGLDLIGFDLGKRNYKINTNSNSCNSFVANYLFLLLELETSQTKKISEGLGIANSLKEKNLTIIDPVASLGDILIEASLFNPRVPLNIKKKNEIAFSKIFSEINFPKNLNEKTKNKFIGIVQNNKIFKQIKENISYSSQKIKVSQYELDFLDVKFKKEQIDYLICNFPLVEKEFLKEFFYQAEFIIKKKIGIISKKTIDEKIIKKYKLLIKIKKEILVGKQKYYIYVLSKK